jgi:hypothetical protein
MQPVGVVAAGGQQLGGGLHADADDLQQVWAGPFDQAGQAGIQVGDLGQVLPALGQAAQGVAGTVSGIGQVVPGSQSGAGLNEFGAPAAGEVFAQLRRRGDQQRL